MEIDGLIEKQNRESESKSRIRIKNRESRIEMRDAEKMTEKGEERRENRDEI